MQKKRQNNVGKKTLREYCEEEIWVLIQYSHFRPHFIHIVESYKYTENFQSSKEFTTTCHGIGKYPTFYSHNVVFNNENFVVLG